MSAPAKAKSQSWWGEQSEGGPSKQPVKNQDLWQRLYQALAPHRVRWHWVKGHAGHADNECVDQAARDAARAQEAGT